MPRAVLLGMGRAPQSVGAHHPAPQHVSQLPTCVTALIPCGCGAPFLTCRQEGLQK